MADISAFPWLNSWAIANGAVANVQYFLSNYPSSWIRQDDNSPNWQNAGTAATQSVKIPMPPDTCEYEWTSTGWQLRRSSICPPSQPVCTPRNNVAPMPIGMRVTVPCH